METERLIIRKFTPSDWRELFEYLSREDVVRYEPYEVFSEEACRLEAARRSQDDRFLAVCLKDGGRLIGNIYLDKQEFETWELGYVFNPAYHRRGYATEAARTAADDLFKNRNAHRIISMCNPLNEPSWRLMERLGMRREAHLRRNIYFKRDKEGRPIWQDTYQYGILDEEWLGEGT